MQAESTKAIGKRARYYHSQIDMESLLSGARYSELSDSYVIFICDYDPFGKKKYCYTCKTKCLEDSDIDIGDGSVTIFLSTKGKNPEDVPDEMVKFLKYVGADLEESTADFDDAFVSRIQKSVDRIKSSRELEGKYMILQEMLENEWTAGRTVGREEGEAVGEKNMLLKSIQNRFSHVPNALSERIASETRSDVIFQWLKNVYACSTIEEFQKFVDEFV